MDKGEKRDVLFSNVRGKRVSQPYFAPCLQQHVTLLILYLTADSLCHPLSQPFPTYPETCD